MSEQGLKLKKIFEELNDEDLLYSATDDFYKVKMGQIYF